MIDTRQRINRHLADKDQVNLVGCPLDRDFSRGPFYKTYLIYEKLEVSLYVIINFSL